MLFRFQSMISLKFNVVIQITILLIQCASPKPSLTSLWGKMSSSVVARGTRLTRSLPDLKPHGYIFIDKHWKQKLSLYIIYFCNAIFVVHISSDTCYLSTYINRPRIKLLGEPTDKVIESKGVYVCHLIFNPVNFCFRRENASKITAKKSR